VPYTGPQIKDYGTVADLTATHQLFSGLPGPSVSLLAFSSVTSTPNGGTPTTPTTSVNSTPSTPTTPSANGPGSSTGPLTTVGPTAGTPSAGAGGPGGGGAHSVPGAAGKLPFTGLNVVAETVLGAGAVISGFVARRLSRKPSE
jgi:hypothetical protein